MITKLFFSAAVFLLSCSVSTWAILAGIDVVSIGTFPYVGLLAVRNSFNEFYCNVATTTLSPEFVVTTADCVSGFELSLANSSVYFNTFGPIYDQNDFNLEYKIQRVYIHPNWTQNRDYGYNFALLKLKTPLPSSHPKIKFGTILNAQEARDRLNQPKELMNYVTAAFSMNMQHALVAGYTPIFNYMSGYQVEQDAAVCSNHARKFCVLSPLDVFESQETRARLPCDWNFGSVLVEFSKVSQKTFEYLGMFTEPKIRGGGMPCRTHAIFSLFPKQWIKTTIEEDANHPENSNDLCERGQYLQFSPICYSVDDFYPVFDHENTYYNCTQPYAIPDLVVCTGDTYFDIKNRDCYVKTTHSDEIREVYCTSTEIQAECERSALVKVGDECDYSISPNIADGVTGLCQSYLSCDSSGRYVQKFCNNQWHFNYKTKSCQYKNISNCLMCP